MMMNQTKLLEEIRKEVKPQLDRFKPLYHILSSLTKYEQTENILNFKKKVDKLLPKLNQFQNTDNILKQNKIDQDNIDQLRSILDFKFSKLDMKKIRQEEKIIIETSKIKKNQIEIFDVFKQIEHFKNKYPDFEILIENQTKSEYFQNLDLQGKKKFLKEVDIDLFKYQKDLNRLKRVDALNINNIDYQTIINQDQKLNTRNNYVYKLKINPKNSKDVLTFHERKVTFILNQIDVVPLIIVKDNKIFDVIHNKQRVEHLKGEYALINICDKLEKYNLSGVLYHIRYC